jgi:hypothetical protein
MQAWLLVLPYLDAVLCIRWPFQVPQGLILAATGLSERQVLVLLHKLRSQNLACHHCYGAPISHYGDDPKQSKRKCLHCGALLCAQCKRLCDKSVCRDTRPGWHVMCPRCAAIRCAAPDCQSAECQERRPCAACRARVCPVHTLACRKCQSACCAACCTIYADPLFGTEHSLCLACAHEHASLLKRCARLRRKRDG